ncbi:MAG: hypothetical protein HYZ34_03320 [Ignavibacteriae bacterium]|nr:hypothetical protein [Ignavibacteriota bacterium]
MVTNEHILHFTLTEDEIKFCILKAKNNFSIARRDNLRSRHRNIQFDCIVRGYVGEYVILKWVKSFNIEFEKTNYFMEDENMDIDFYYKKKNLELKTSLIPDIDGTVDRAIQIRDIKLIKRDSRIEELKGDVHLQIFFQQRRKAKDAWLQEQKIDLDSPDINYLYQMLFANVYLNTTYIVGWIDKPTLVERINALPSGQRIWKYAKREFWVCPIRTSNPPIELIPYLSDL